MGVEREWLGIGRFVTDMLRILLWQMHGFWTDHGYGTFYFDFFQFFVIFCLSKRHFLSNFNHSKNVDLNFKSQVFNIRVCRCPKKHRMDFRTQPPLTFTNPSLLPLLLFILWFNLTIQRRILWNLRAERSQQIFNLN